eukprot:SM000072S21212  [mRNA]  locus=s72:338837:344159:- [translate_table: standard]
MAPVEHAASVAALFGDDLDSQPLWFKKEAFADPAFDAEAYISDLRRFVPFDTLRAELRSHLAALKHELVELINRDYADFVNLSMRLVRRLPTPAAAPGGGRESGHQLVASIGSQAAGLSRQALLVSDGHSQPFGRTGPCSLRSASRRLRCCQPDECHGPASKQVDVDGAVLRMRMPLNELRSRLQAARAAVAGTLAALQDGLKRRAEASEARQMLELLLDTSHVVSKVEKLLAELERMPKDEARAETANGWVNANGILSRGLADAAGDVGVDGGPAGPTGLQDARSRLLERIASEMNRLKFYAVKAKDLPFIQATEKRIAAADSKVGEHLRACLEGGLERREERVIYHCLRAYAALDSTAGAEEAFREAVVAPLVAQAVQGGSLGRPPAAAAGSTAGADLLEPAYAALEQVVVSQLKFLLDIASTSNSGLHNFKFLSNSILREVHNALHKWRPGAFSPGKPDEFLANYNASLAFISFLEGYCHSEAAVLAFRSHVAYSEFLRSWNLGVYFTLRFQEIAGALDQALRAPNVTVVAPPKASPGAAGAGTTPNFAFQQTVMLWECLQRCWRPDVCIASIHDKFLRLSLQLLSRFSMWLSAGLAMRKGGEEALAAGGEWGASATPEDFVLTRHDVSLLGRLVKGEYTYTVLRKLGPHVDEACQGAVQESIGAGVDAALASLPAITEVLTDAVAEKCMEFLKQVKGVTAVYRMTNKPLPTRHSPYVPDILRPLRAFVEGDRAALIAEKARAELVATIVDRVTTRYDNLAQELVTTARRTESSLKRLRQGASRTGMGADTAGAHISDSDKMVAQLFLDVQEYGRQLQHFGVNPQAVASYTTLWQCVAPPDRAPVQ